MQYFMAAFGFAALFFWGWRERRRRFLEALQLLAVEARRSAESMRFFHQQIEPWMEYVRGELDRMLEEAFR